MCKTLKRRHRTPSVPRELRKEITQHVRSIARRYRDLFKADHELKNRILRLERALLPPRPRRRGRPGNPEITLALKLRAKLSRQFPEETPRQICERLYIAAIAGYTNMGPMEKREARERLQQRMTWRRRKRRPKKIPAEIAVS